MFMKNKELNIKGALLDKQSLCYFLEKLASSQVPQNFSGKDTYPIIALKNNFHFILETYTLLQEHIKLNILIHPAGEWLLDNFYVIEEITKTIEKELTLKKYINLVGITNGTWKGFARIYVLASHIIAYTDGKIEEQDIKDFLIAYQSKKTLTMEEIWCFPIFLQIAIIQNIREICENIYASQIQKYKVESIIERLVDKKETLTFQSKVVAKEQLKEHMKYPFIEYMSYKLKRYGKKASSYLDILEEQVNKMGATISEIIKKEHFDIAVNKVAIGNLITSLKEMSRIDFLEIFESINGANEILKQDPAGIYEKMDYKTKNYYREIINKIYKKTKISEVYIAKTILKMAQQEKEKLEQKNIEKIDSINSNMEGGTCTRNQKKTHIGYFLLEDRNALYKSLDTNIKELTKEQKAKLYVQINYGLSFILTIIISIMFYRKSNMGIALLLGILAYIPVTQIIMKILDYILLKVTKPTLIPKMDCNKGIEEKAATFVVIPTIITSTKKVEELVHKLEVYYLANKSNNLYFAILGDASSR